MTDYKLFQELNKIDKIVSRRISSGKWFYRIWLILSNLIIVLISVISFYVRDGLESKATSFALISFFILLIDFLSFFLKVKDKGLLLSRHLWLFPLSEPRKIRLFTLLRIFDFRTSMYITGFVLTVWISFSNQNAGTVIGFFFSWLLLYLTMTFSSIFMMRLIDKVITSMSTNIVNIIPIMLAVLLLALSQVFNISDLLNLPLVGNFSLLLLALLTANIKLMLIHSLSLMAFMIAGLAILIYGPKNKLM